MAASPESRPPSHVPRVTFPESRSPSHVPRVRSPSHVPRVTSPESRPESGVPDVADAFAFRFFPDLSCGLGSNRSAFRSGVRNAACKQSSRRPSRCRCHRPGLHRRPPVHNAPSAMAAFCPSPAGSARAGWPAGPSGNPLRTHTQTHPCSAGNCPSDVLGRAACDLLDVGVVGPAGCGAGSQIGTRV